MDNEDQIRDYVKQAGQIPDSAGKLVLALFNERPNRYVSPPMIEEAVRRGAIRIADVVRWLDERQSCLQSIDLVDIWPHIPADHALAVGALRKLLEHLLLNYRSRTEGIHGKCGRVVEVLVRLSRSVQDTAAIIHLLATALNAERQRDDRTHLYAQPFMTWLAELGNTEAFQIEVVEPWEGMLIHWKANKYSWKDAIVGLAKSGASDSVSPEALSQWLGPESDGHAVDTFMSLPGFDGGRMAFACGLRDEDEYDKLLTDLGHALRPAVDIQAAWDEKQLRLLRYICQGVERLLQFEDPGCVLNHVASVGKEFNNLMRELERPERAFMMIEPPHWENDGAVFLCADDQQFIEIKDRLRLPFARPEDHRWIG